MLYRSVVLYVDNAKRGNRNKDGVQ
jgi:hypothetical protein